MENRIPDEAVRIIKEKASIVDVLVHYGIQMEIKGGRKVAQCPFHPDPNPSLYVNLSGKYANSCHCFVCNQHWDPIAFIMEKDKIEYPKALRTLASIEGVNIGLYEAVGNYPQNTPSPPRDKLVAKTTSQLPPLSSGLNVGARPFPVYWKREDVRMSRSNRNKMRQSCLYGYLTGLFGVDSVEDTFRLYCVGADDFWRGMGPATVFWYVDPIGNIVMRKTMQYGPDGHRYKGEFNEEKEAALISVNYPDRSNHALEVLFGSHLLNTDKHPDLADHNVCIVESEKSALMAHMSQLMPDSIWLATGGNQRPSQTIKRQSSDLCDRNIILWPDAAAIEDWKMEAEAINELGINCSCISDYWEGTIYSESKSDVADLIDLSKKNPSTDKTGEVPATFLKDQINNPVWLGIVQNLSDLVPDAAAQIAQHTDVWQLITKK